jgi:hypothetical protein
VSGEREEGELMSKKREYVSVLRVLDRLDERPSVYTQAEREWIRDNPHAPLNPFAKGGMYERAQSEPELKTTESDV